jgi:hypothetical protein
MILSALKLDSIFISKAAARLMYLSSHKSIQHLVKSELIPSGAYRVQLSHFHPDAILKVALLQDISSINHTLDVYAGGMKPNYPLIDSNSLGISSVGKFPRGYRDRLRQIGDLLIRMSSSDRRFLALPLTAAEMFLAINGRLQAADFEPMELGVNAKAVKCADTINWKRYPYSVILVPGAGPANYDVKISSEAMIRLGLAYDAYKKGLAPFILVSGGKVHPYMTQTCEALEMKKYLMEVLGIPEHAIIMDPHARHTTTNMRNAARLMIKYHFPLQTPGLVCTTVGQSRWITTTLPYRCKVELGYVPYTFGRKLDAYLTEFHASLDAMQVDFDEPIDP